MTKVHQLSKIKYFPSKGLSYRPIFVASGILIVEGKVLLIRRNKTPDRGSWVLPSGHVENQETPAHAAAREFYEETGLRVHVKRLITIEQYFYTEKRTRTIIIEFIYEMTRNNRNHIEVKLDNSHSEFEFVSKANLNRFRSLVRPRSHAVLEVFKSLNK